MKNVTEKQEASADSTLLAVEITSPQVEQQNAEKTVQKETKPHFFSAGNLAVMAILSALSFILYATPFLKFSLPFIFPSFLDMQFSDLPALLGGFALGPVAGCIIIVVKCCLKMPMTSTGCVGELADIIVGIAFVLPAALIYKRNKSRKGALIGLLVGMLSAVGVSILANWLILIPFYASLQEIGIEGLLSMMQALYPEITADTLYNYYLPLAVLPFNMLRCLVCAVITYFVYKPLSKALHWEIKHKNKPVGAEDASGHNV